MGMNRVQEKQVLDKCELPLPSLRSGRCFQEHKQSCGASWFIVGPYCNLTPQAFDRRSSGTECYAKATKPILLMVLGLVLLLASSIIFAGCSAGNHILGQGSTKCVQHVQIHYFCSTCLKTNQF